MTGSVNIPIFRFVTGDAFWDRVKKIAMSSFAMKATGAFTQQYITMQPLYVCRFLTGSWYPTNPTNLSMGSLTLFRAGSRLRRHRGVRVGQEEENHPDVRNRRELDF